jgi:hypothetical protein
MMTARDIESCTFALHCLDLFMSTYLNLKDCVMKSGEYSIIVLLVSHSVIRSRLASTVDSSGLAVERLRHDIRKERKI